jgi:hypothetical protein
MDKKELIMLDFTEQDTLAALEYLMSLCRDNKVAGMVFAVSMKHKRAHPHLCGATGRLATDLVEAAGVGSMLNMKLTQEALETSTRDR